MSVTIIGIDCAAQEKNTGLARAIFDEGELTVQAARCASRDAPACSIVSQWIKDSGRVLLALDAPLGWPVALGGTLARHCAGEPLAPSAHQMFRRLTDDLIYERLGRRPLEVAADRIARCAHAALRLLEELRRTLSVDIPLVWSARWRGRLGAIEVYPAATLISLGIPRGSSSWTALRPRTRLRSRPNSEHARDAAVCALAGAEFLSGRTVAPRVKQMQRAKREGWIWAGTPASLRFTTHPSRSPPCAAGRRGSSARGP